MTVENVNRALLKPLALTVASVAAVLVLTPFVPLTTQAAPAVAAAPQPVIEASLTGGLDAFWTQYGQGLMILLLLFAAFFSFYGNGAVLWRIARGNLKLAGGSITHVGFALMLLGIVSSTVFNDPITDGQGADIRGDRDNFILQRGEPQTVDGYTVRYDGKHFNDRGRTVYNIDFTTPNGKEFRAENEVYQSKTEQWIQHPHVENFADEDIYVAVFPSAMMDGGGRQQGAPGELFLQRGQTARLDDGAYTVEFVSYDLEPEVEGVETDSLDLSVGAELRVTETATGETRTVAPVYLILKDRTQQYVQHRIPEWGLAFSFTGMQVENDSVRLVVEGADTPSEDWIVVQAYRKPFINLLWFGTFVLAVGFILSIVRRTKEQRNR